MNNNEITPKEYSKLLVRIKFLKKKYGHTLDRFETEEILNEIIVRRLEGKGQHQTIEQSVIDIIRKYNGRTRIDGSNPRGDFEKASEYIDDRVQYSRCDGINKDDRESVNRLSKHLGRDERMILKLHKDWGLNEIEIGDLFGVSESRISQRIKGIQERLHEKIKREESGFKRERPAIIQGILSKDEGRFTGMEFLETKAMEIKSF